MTTRLPPFVLLSLFLHGAVLAVWTGGATHSPGARPGLQFLPVSLLQPARSTPAAAQTAASSLQRASAATASASTAETRRPDSSSGTTAVTVSNQPQIEATGQQLQQALHNALLPHFYYPLLARSQGWQGEALFAVHVAANGRLSQLQLTHSSGYAVLDRAALDSLGKIRELPDALQHDLGAHGMTLHIPVVYKLTEG